MKTYSRRSFMRLAGGTITACMVPTSLIMTDDAKRVWMVIDWGYHIESNEIVDLRKVARYKAIHLRDTEYRRFTQNLIENVSNQTGVGHEELLKSIPKAD